MLIASLHFTADMTIIVHQRFFGTPCMCEVLYVAAVMEPVLSSSAESGTDPELNSDSPQDVAARSVFHF